MATRMPAARRSATASAAPSRGGSSKPTSPSRVSPVSTATAEPSPSGPGGPPGSARRATAITRSPRVAISAAAGSTSGGASAQARSTDSTEPFTCSPSAVAADTRRRCGSNGQRRSTSTGAAVSGPAPEG